MKLQRIIPNKNVLIVVILLLLNVVSFLFYVTVKNSTNFMFNEKYSINDDKPENGESITDLIKTTVSHLSTSLFSKINGLPKKFHYFQKLIFCLLKRIYL